MNYTLYIVIYLFNVVEHWFWFSNSVKLSSAMMTLAVLNCNGDDAGDDDDDDDDDRDDEFVVNRGT